MDQTDCQYRVTTFVKPGAKFKDIAPGDTKHFDQDDVVVLLGGTNDIACNEAKGLLAAFREKMLLLKTNNLVVFSVPFRFDLPQWSCVNKEIQKTNNTIKNICKRFKNCMYVDISNIGSRFHTRNGLHLNWLGKQYVGKKIIDCVNNFLERKAQPHPQTSPIPLPCGPFLDQ